MMILFPNSVAMVQTTSAVCHHWLCGYLLVRLAAYAALLATLLFAVPATANCTSPVPGGDPNNPGQCAGVGNPINVMTGNKYQREEDMPALPGVLGLEIVRHYNSAFSGPSHPNGVLGRGWRLSYEIEVVDRWGKVQVLLADGGRVIFDRDLNAPTGCSTRDPANGTMTIGRQNDGRPNYTWTWTDGRKLHFNTAGKLDRIAAPSGEVVRLLYDDQNVLVRVIDPQGRSLNLVYYDRNTPNQFHGVQFIDTPVGRFGYEYGSELPKGAGLLDKRQLLANLVRVRLPDEFDPTKKAHPLSSRGTTINKTSRIYHHEDPRSPWLMTGLSIETIGADGKATATRYSTYGYDDTGRAILSTHAGNVGKVTLDNSKAGVTVLTNSLGQRTTYRYAVIGGEYRLREVRGAGCAWCGEPNVRYRYDDAGRLIGSDKLSENGEPIVTIRTERDKLGRVERVSKFVYQNGKRGPARLLARYEYRGDGFAPALVARPSVVPGKELVTRIEYNQAFQPTSVTESGWVPTADGKQAAARIERSVGYRYVNINGRSLLAAIDGPLPNGKANTPADSDITIFEYDGHPAANESAPAGLASYTLRSGLLTRVIAPGNFVTEVLERDSALRPARVRTIDGAQDQVVTIASDWRSAPVHLELAAGDLHWNLDYEYNAMGNVAAMILPGGLRASFGHDVAGRQNLIVLPDGSAVAHEQDTENHLLHVTRLLEALGKGHARLAELSFTHERAVDKPGRLAEISTSTGLLKRYRYDDVGRVTSVRTALGITAAFAYGPTGLMASRTDAVGSEDAAIIDVEYDHTGHATGITAGNGVKTMRRYDDFGRKVLEADPDRGITIFRHDAAGHLIAQIDESMVATRYTYDHAGRLLTVGADRQPNLIHYRYRGHQLQAVISTPDGRPEHATERTEYERDALGRVTKETRWLAKLVPTTAVRTQITFVTTSEYNKAGRLSAQTLPGGHHLDYRYTPVDVDKASGRRPGQLDAILFDGNVVVSNIEQTIAGGLTGYTMSNGARQKIVLDQSGRIEQLQVLASPSTSLWGRFKAWFAGTQGKSGSEHYRQVNHYDADGRVAQIDRRMATPSGTAHSRSEQYGYDQMNRLSRIDAAGNETIFQYDKGGNRISKTDAITGGSTNAGPSRKELYSYATGTNRLIAIFEKSSNTTMPTNGDNTAQWLRNAWFHHPTGVPLAQLLRSEQGERHAQRIVYNAAKRPVEVYHADRLIARYHYDVHGQRVAKTVYSDETDPLRSVSNLRDEHGTTTYYLYQDGRLTGEADRTGQLTTHYVYLGAKPVAKIQMAPSTSPLHRLLTFFGVSAPDTDVRIYSVVADHLGVPQMVLGPAQTVVWQADTSAFGESRLLYAAIGEDGRAFEMNVRLPGQLYDAETGLSQNYFRDYDPKLGRYSTPDPIGIAGGTNPYAYVSSNPLSSVDPLGLYQSDVHYYATFFLAVAAGFNYDEARTISLADQYIDDNPLTRPIDVDITGNPSYIKTIFNNAQRLKYYHFTLSDDNGQTMPQYRRAAVADGLYYPSQQLRNLRGAAERAPNKCAELQFFGEYLHAFADTFSHRDSNDLPVDAVWRAGTNELGIGHGPLGTNPDMTYNHWSTSYVVIPTHWNTNESRTLEMERSVFTELVALRGGLNKPVRDASLDRFSAIEPFLRKFNAIAANEETMGQSPSRDPSRPNFASKIGELQTALVQLGLGNVDMKPGGSYGYDEAVGASARTKNLNGLKQQDFPGTCIKSC